MRNPKIVSPTCQEFQGVRYYLCGRYFQAGGVRLHRVVWTAKHKRQPPKGYHVHHDDEDRGSNRWQNLILKQSGKHLADHMTPERREWARRNVVEHAVPAARAWHRSPAGRKVHRRIGRDSWKNRPYRTLTCQQCGGPYQTRKVGNTKFCHLNCKMAALRQRRKAGVRSV